MTPNRTRPSLVQFESRTNPSGISFTNGNLVVDGTAAADTIRVYFYGTDATRVAAVLQTGGVTQSKIFSRALVKSVTLNGNAGNDTILNDTNIPVSSTGGVGNDSIWGGSGNDTITGDAGDDMLVGRGGSDVVDGGDGNDQVFGGDGNDSLMGGAGNDNIVG